MLKNIAPFSQHNYPDCVKLDVIFVDVIDGNLWMDRGIRHIIISFYNNH